MASRRSPDQIRQCVYVYDGPGEKRCVSRLGTTGSPDYCAYHSEKIAEEWAGVYSDRLDEGATFDVALSLPVLDGKRLGELTIEERRGLGLMLARRFPLVGEAA